MRIHIKYGVVELSRVGRRARLRARWPQTRGGRKLGRLAYASTSTWKHFLQKCTAEFPWSRLGGSKITYVTANTVKRLYVPLENQNQKALISSYD
jgi:hypothetical protein